jgi:uncharacterized small protein (TIGR04563 family)
MSSTDKRKQSLYFPEDMLKEIKGEATRQDRSLSWIVQKAWKIARSEVSRYPAVNDLEGGDDDVRGRDEP